MKKTTLILSLLISGFFACSDKGSEQFSSDQALVEDKLKTIQEIIKKYDLPDSLYQKIAQLKPENQKELIEMNMATFEQQISDWASLQKTFLTQQEEIGKWAELDREKWKEINEETDQKKKTALEEDYWTTFFPKMKQATDSLKGIQQNN